MLRLQSHWVLPFVAVFFMPSSLYGGDSTSENSPGPLGEAASPSTEPVITKLYDVGFLVASQQPPLSVGTKISDGYGATRGSGVSGLGGAGGWQGGFGGGMGGGGMGGGGMGGGGLYSLPVEPSQFGGGGMGGVVYQSSANSTVSAASISALIQQMVAPNSWVTNGGTIGDITVFGNLLIVRQTEPVQKEIDGLLKGLTHSVVATREFQLEAWWLPVNESVQGELKGILNGPHEESVMAEKLTALSQSEAGFHGTLRCREHVECSMSSGDESPVVIGATPVVGTGAVGHAPIVEMLQMGLTLAARISAVPSPEAAAASTTEVVDLNFSSMIASRELKIEFSDEPGEIDRYTIGRHQADGTCRLPLGQPALVAALTQLSEPSGNAGSESELQLIVRITRLAR